MAQLNTTILPAEIKRLPNEARVWIYQSNRTFSEDESRQMEGLIRDFTRSWVSHNRALTAMGTLLFNRIILLVVDETRADASGCSIDSSVHFLQELGRRFSADLFDRLTFAYFEGEELRFASREEFNKAYREGKISDETLVLDNLVQTKGALEATWIKPLANSWHKRMLPNN